MFFQVFTRQFWITLTMIFIHIFLDLFTHYLCTYVSIYLHISIYIHFLYGYIYIYINSNSISTTKMGWKLEGRPVSKLLCDCQNFLCLICLPGKIFSQIPAAFFANKLQFPTVASASSLELHSWQGMAIQEACRVQKNDGCIQRSLHWNWSWRTEMQPGPSCDRACLRAMRKNTDRADLVIAGKFQVWCGITWVSHMVFTWVLHEMTPFGSGACSVHFATPACDSARVQEHPWKASSPSSRSETWIV